MALDEWRQWRQEGLEEAQAQGIIQVPWACLLNAHGCFNKALSLDLCETHYQHWLKYSHGDFMGDPMVQFHPRFRMFLAFAKYQPMPELPKRRGPHRKPGR